MATTGERLKAWREEHGLRQRAFAELAGVNQERISKCENGKTVPGIEVAVAIERATGGAIAVLDWLDNGSTRLRSAKRPSRRNRRSSAPPASR